MADTPMTPDVAAVQQAAIRAIHALKSPTPDGSRHYQSGWDDGLEAAIDAARDGVEGPARTLLAEVDRLRKALSDAAGQVAELEDGLGQASAENAALRERTREAARPSRFSATPAQVDAFLRQHFAEDTYLSFQQAIGAHALEEAVEDAGAVRASADNDGLYKADWREGWDDAIERVDPDRNGPTPVQLIKFGEATS